MNQILCNRMVMEQMENLQNEIWMDCKGYEGLYQVSNLGRVKSLERVRTNHTGGMWVQPETILTGKKTGDGYIAVHLRTPQGKDKIERVHRLVAIVFVENPDKLPEVNHLNSIRDDNRATNLSWVSHQENIQYTVDQGHMTKTKILCITTGQVFNTSTEAAKVNGGDAGNIRKAARLYAEGARRTVFGYSYCYIRNEDYYLNKKQNGLDDPKEY